jgi:hypothetical protein
MPSLGSSVASDYISAAIPALISLFIYSTFFSLFMGAAWLAIKNKFSVKKTLSFSKYFFGNFLLFIPFIVINLILLYSVNQIKIADFQYTYLIQAIIYFLSYALLANFLIFSFFYHTLKNKSIYDSIKNSIKTSLKNYLIILIIPVSYFLVTIPVSMIQVEILKDIIYFLIVFPLFTLILTSLFENVSGK